MNNIQKTPLIQGQRRINIQPNVLAWKKVRDTFPPEGDVYKTRRFYGRKQETRNDYGRDQALN